MTNRLFIFGLGVSTLLHAMLVFGLAAALPKTARKPAKVIEVTYAKLPEVIKVEPVVTPRQDVQLLREKKKSQHVEILNRRYEADAAMTTNIKDITPLTTKFKSGQKMTPGTIGMDGERRIDIPMLKVEKISNPKYLSYNQSIRQLIRQQAYNYVDHPEFASGFVYLTFVLDKGGFLKEIQVIESKTQANEYLRKVGLRSVREAQPFGAFPPELSFDELTFNVVISFELVEGDN